MSTPRVVSIQQNFKKIPVLGLVAEQSSSAPASPVNGQTYYDTTLNRHRVYENGAWQNASAAGLAAASHTHAATDVFPNIAGLQDGDALLYTTGGWYNGKITPANVGSSYKDGAAGNQSLRSLGIGAQQAMPGNMRLDEITDPAAPVTMNGQKITGLADGTASGDAVTKGQLDSVSAGLDAKPSVKVATTGNITLSGTQTIDGVSVSAGDRVLVKLQSSTPENGIYIVAAGAWSRAPDLDTFAEAPGAFTFVEQGTTNGDTGWVSIADQGGVLGSSSIVWTQFSGGASLTAGAGLSQSGNTFDVNVDGVGIEVNADILRLKDLGVVTAKIADNAVTLTAGAGQKVTGTLPVANGGTGATTAAAARTALAASTGTVISTHTALSAGTELLITHNLGTKNIIVKVYRISDDVEEELGIRAASTTQVGVTSDVAYAADTFRFIILAIGV
jgi:hypothetical protein